MFPPAVLAWEAFQKVTLVAPWVASEASKVLMVRDWTLVCDAIRFTTGASPPCLSGRTGRKEDGACIGKGQTKSDQEGKAFDPIDGSPPGSLVPGILQARTLEWVAISSSRGSSRPRD